MPKIMQCLVTIQLLIFSTIVVMTINMRNWAVTTVHPRLSFNQHTTSKNKERRLSINTGAISDSE
jgi:hypothetical protein